MSDCPGILVMSDHHLILDVHAEHWSPPEIQRRLQTRGGIVFRDIAHRGVRLAINEALNSPTAGLPARAVGFRLFDELVFGDALIIAADGALPPALVDPEYVAHRIHFLRVEHTCAQGRYAHEEFSYLDDAPVL